MTDPSTSADVEHVTSRTEIAERIQDACTQAEVEVLSMVPATALDAKAFKASLSQDIELLNRGLVCRVLYHAEAVNSPAVMKILDRFACDGAQVRITRAVPHRLVLIDRKLAVVPARADDPASGALFVTQPVVVSSFVGQFSQLWRAGRRVGQADRDLNVALIHDTVSMLRSGVTDEVAAKQLNVSVRTLRRRVASVLEMLGASSRFEAGVKASEAGWL